VNSFNEKLHFSSFFVWLENPHVTHSRALIAMGTADSLKEACKRLETLLEAVTAIHNTFHKIDLLVLQGLALYKLSRIQESLEIMEEALRLAEPGGWVRPFVELGKPMEEMLKQLQVKKSDRNFIEQLLAAFILREQETQVVASPAQPVSELLVEPLTNRELEILNLLAQNLYNKEIGERLYISTETVKTHLKGIYQKLKAGNRREAVAKARTIGLLSNS
jgi:LuxR family maltose regulon positive regulatory protein